MGRECIKDVDADHLAMSTPQSRKYTVTPDAPRKRRRREDDDDDDDAGELRGELLELLQRTSKLPASILFFLLTDAGAFLQPQLIEKRLAADGKFAEADAFRRAIDMSGFWRAIARQCFPLVTQLPVVIEQRVRSNHYKAPTKEARDNAAWADALRYIGTVLSNIYVGVTQGGRTTPNVRFESPLSLVEDPLATCSKYADEEHVASYRFDVPANNDEDETAYQFSISVTASERDGGNGFSDDELEVDIDDFPGVNNFGALSTSAIQDMFSANGALVHESKAAFPNVYAPFMQANYRLYWRLLNRGRLAQRLASPTPELATRVEARLSVTPKFLDDRALWAIGVRQTSALSEVSHELLPVELIVTRSEQTTIDERSAVIAQDFLDVPARTMLMHPNEYAGIGFRNTSLFSFIRQLYEDVVGARAPPGSQTVWQIDIGWEKDGTPIEALDIQFRSFESSHSMLGEWVGPPRPGRPVLEGQPHATWYSGSVFDANNEQRTVRVVCQFVSVADDGQ